MATNEATAAYNDGDVGFRAETANEAYHNAIRREAAAWHAAHCRGCGAVWEDPEPGISAYLCAECSGEGKTHESLDAEDAARRAAPETLPGLAPLTPSEEAALLAFRAGQAVTRELVATDARPAARVTEDELAEIERAAKQIRDGNWPPPGAATILLCERTSDLADEVRALRGERDDAQATIERLKRQVDDAENAAMHAQDELAARPAPAADASLEALGRIVRAAWVEVAKKEAKTVPGYVDLWKWLEIPDADTDRKIGEQVVRAVDASRPASPAFDAEDLWTDYRTGRGTVFASDRKAFLAGVEAGRRTREPDMGAADASRPGLTGDAWTALAQVIATLAENDSLVDDAIAAAERAGCPDATVLHLHEINDAMYRRRLRGSRPGLTEEQADAIALGCLQVREDLQRHAIKRAILRVDRGETGPATEPTRAERVAEAQRLRAEARAEAEACTVPMPADLLARYPRSADPPQPDRPSGLTRAMHDAQQRPSVPPPFVDTLEAELAADKEYLDRLPTATEIPPARKQ